MDVTYFNNIPFHLERDEIGEILKLRKRESMMETLDEQIQLAMEVAVPKAAYFDTLITAKDEGSVTFGGQVFHSKTLAEALALGQMIYPYIITIGTEMEEKYQALDDIMEQYILDGVQGIILGQATDFVANALKEKYRIDQVVYHIPGALDDWDLQEQPYLFELFGETQARLGVVLSHSHLMRPSKSVSGVYYAVK
jgi:hypothetical protein